MKFANTTKEWKSLTHSPSYTTAKQEATPIHWSSFHMRFCLDADLYSRAPYIKTEPSVKTDVSMYYAVFVIILQSYGHTLCKLHVSAPRAVIICCMNCINSFSFIKQHSLSSCTLSIKPLHYPFLLLELGLGKSQCVGYFMEDQVKENFRYVLSIRMLNETLQDKTVVWKKDNDKN